MRKKIYITLIFVFCTLVSFAQEVDFKVEVSRNKIAINESIRVEFIINVDVDKIEIPEFKDFNISNRDRVVNNNIVNGKMTFSKSYSFILMPKREGKLKIESAFVNYKGENYSTKEVYIEVGKEISSPKHDKSRIEEQRSMSMFGANMIDDMMKDFFDRSSDFFSDDFPSIRQESAPTKYQELKKDDMFILAEVSTKNPYVNQVVKVKYTLYYSEEIKPNIRDILKEPDFSSFIKEFFPTDWSKIKVEKTQYNSKTYNTALIKEGIIIPRQAKQYRVGEYELALSPVVYVRDRYGRVLYMPTNMNSLKSNTIVLNVIELPLQGKPANFSGAVGHFSLETSLNKNSLKSQESAIANITIAGEGNFNLFEVPSFSFPQNIEVFDPEKKDNVRQTATGYAGSISRNYLILSQYRGKYTIPKVEFSYFDPNKHKYEVLSTSDLNFEVSHGKDVSNENNISRNEIKKQEQEFKFLKTTTKLEPKNKEKFINSWLYYLLLILPFVLIPLSIFVAKKYKNKEDEQEQKVKRANKMAKKYLKESYKYLEKQDKDKFYEALYRGINLFLKAQLKIENSSMTIDNVREKLLSQGKSVELVQKLTDIMEICNKARYSPYTQTDMQRDYEKTIQVISEL